MSQPFKLYRLQQLDSQLDRVQTRLREIETILSEDEQLRLAQSEADEAAIALEQARKALRQAESNVQQQRIKIEQTEAALYGGKVRNPKELQDLQNDAAALKRYRSVLEDRQLEAMLAEEDALAAQFAALARLEKTQADTAQRNQGLLEEKNRLLQESAHINQERTAAAASIPEADLALYEKLRLQRRGIAVSKVTNKACSACGSTLNATLLDSARSPNQLSRCDVCGRILYLG
jgi:predicted  nucleic acid-binding Zn-ribbon protein